MEGLICWGIWEIVDTTGVRQKQGKAQTVVVLAIGSVSVGYIGYQPYTSGE